MVLIFLHPSMLPYSSSWIPHRGSQQGVFSNCYLNKMIMTKEFEADLTD